MILPPVLSVALTVMPCTQGTIVESDALGLKKKNKNSTGEEVISVYVCVTVSDTVCVIFVRGSQIGLPLTSNAFWSWTKEVSDPTNVH